MPSAVYGPTLGRAYGQPNPAFRASLTTGGHALAATWLHHAGAGFGFTDPLPHSDAYMAVLHFAPLADHTIWSHGDPVHTGSVAAGSSCLVDLASQPMALYRDPFDAMHLHIPVGALLEFSEEQCRAPIRRLAPPADWFTDDHVIRAIGECLRRQFIDGYADDQLLVDHALLALRAHLAVRYGGGQLIPQRQRTGLAPWQQRRALELLRENLTEGIALKDIARECCLSESGLLRAFTTSMGTSPHRWLSGQRVELAMELMRSTAQSLADVAAATGFADQAHFTRVFGKHIGTSPGAWRRQLARKPAEAVAA
jgi:AraC-type DNA-binding domain-containing proteins